MNLKNITEIPAFKLLLIAILIAIASVNLLDITSFIILFGISILTAIVSLIFFKFKLLAYISFASAIGLTLGLNITNAKYEFPDKIIPEFNAAIDGTITKITKRDTNSATAVIFGTIDTPELPKIQNTSILLKIYGNTNNLKAGTYIRTYGKARIPNPKVLPTDFDEETYFAGQGINWLARVHSNNIAWNEEANNIYSFREIITKSLEERISILFGNSTDGLVRAIVLGDKSGILPETRHAFSLAGTAHVLALSGLHVGIIAFIIFTFLNFIPNKYLKFIIFSISLIAFVFITGFQPSAIRAAFMAILIVLAKTTERDYNLLNIISVVVLITLLFEPSLLYSAGFQMSVAAIFGIALLYEPTKKMFDLMIVSNKYFLLYLKNSLSLTISASAIVSPIVAYYFGVFSIISPLTNIFVIPLISLAYIFALTTLFLSYISMPLALLYSESATFLLLLSEQINVFAASLSFSAIQGKSSIIISICSLLSIFYIVFSKSKKQIVFRASSSLIITSMLLINLNLTQAKSNELLIYPRNQMIVAIMKAGHQHSFVYLSDRKPAQIPRTDFGLIRYLKSLQDSITIAVNGNAGINTADFIREERNFGYIELSPAQQKYIENTYFPNIKLPQIYEIKR